jgi:hypothetical protein
MTDQKGSTGPDRVEGRRMRSDGPSSAIYGMAFFGAMIYFVQHATSFWTVVLGILKAVVWPALLIYRLLQFLQM